MPYYYTTQKKERWKEIASMEDLPSNAKYVTILERQDGETDAYRGDLYFDLDSTDIFESLSDTRTLVKRLVEDYGVTPEVWFSGKKGFHVIVDNRFFTRNPEQFIEKLPLIYKAMAYVVGSGLKTLDMSVYSCGKGRLFRVPGDFREKLGTYKTYISMEMLQSATVSQILVSASSFTPAPDRGTVNLVPRMAELFQLSASMVEFKPPKIPQDGGEQSIVYTDDEQLPKCMADLLALKGVKQGTNFNSIVIALSSFFRSSKERCLQMSEQLLRDRESNSYPTYYQRKYFLDYMLDYAEEHDYKFNCGFVKSLFTNGICSDCKYQVNSKIGDGIIVSDNCYVIMKKKDVEQLSNFVIVPEVKVVSSDGVFLNGKFILNTGKVIKFTGLDNKTIKDRKNFLKFIPFECWYVGDERALQKIGSSLMGYPMSLVVTVDHYGLHKIKDTWYYLDKGGCFDENIDESFSLVLRKNVNSIEVDLASQSLPTPEEMAKFRQNVLYNSPKFVAVTLGWTAACFLRPKLKAFDPNRFKNFPLLMVYGLSGSGKSETLIMLRKLAGFTTPVGNFNTYTTFVREAMLSSSNMHPIIFDEFKRSLGNAKIEKQVMELARQVYGSVDGKKGTKDQKMKTYKRVNPVAIFGEETVSEKATRERTLFINIDKVESRAHEIEYRTFSNLPLAKFGRYILENVIGYTEDDMKELITLGEELMKPFVAEVVDRQYDNALILAMGVQLLEVLFDLNGCLIKGFKDYMHRASGDMQETSKDSDITQTFDIVERMILDDNFRDAGILKITENSVISNVVILDLATNSVHISFENLQATIHKYVKDRNLPYVVPDMRSLQALLENTPAFVTRGRKGVRGKRMWVHTFDIEKLSAAGVIFDRLLDLLTDEQGGKVKGLM